MKALGKNNTQKLVTLPSKKKLVGWFYAVKYKADGTTERYKARVVLYLVANHDYLETFASIAKINIVRVVLSLVANHDWIATI